MKLILSDGVIQCVYSDAIDLPALGKVTINRASSIEFNNDSQLWEVRFTGSDDVVFTDKSRDACVKWEVETLNAALCS